MSEIMNLYLSALSRFAGDGIYVIIAFLCLIVMMFEKSNRHRYAWPVLILILVLLNPFIIVGMEQSVLQEERISKVYMILPIFLLIAYVIAKYCKKWYHVLLACMVLVLTGNFIITKDVYDKPSNPYKINPEVIAVCDCIEENAEDIDGSIKVLAELSLVCEIRQYNPRFILELSRYSYWSAPMDDNLLMQMIGNESSASRLCELAYEADVDYIVISENRIVNGDMNEFGYHVVGSLSGYHIFRIDEKRQ